jgi:hypothetical protein
MPRSSSQKNATESQRTEKTPTVVAKRIREAILDEVFKPADHLGELLEGGQQKRPELTLRSINPIHCLVLNEVKEKTLSQVLRIFGRISAVPNKGIQRVPIEFAKIGKSRFGTGRLALCRNEYDAPPSRLKSVRSARRRTLFRLHLLNPAPDSAYRNSLALEKKNQPLQLPSWEFLAASSQGRRWCSLLNRQRPEDWWNTNYLKQQLTKLLPSSPSLQPTGTSIP